MEKRHRWQKPLTAARQLCQQQAQEIPFRFMQGLGGRERMLGTLVAIGRVAAASIWVNRKPDQVRPTLIWAQQMTRECKAWQPMAACLR